MNFVSAFLTPTVINAVLRHVVTAGLTAALAKGWVTPDSVGGIASGLGVVVSALTAGASSTPAAVAKQTTKNGLVAVPPAAVSDRTWGDPNAR